MQSRTVLGLVSFLAAIGGGAAVALAAQPKPAVISYPAYSGNYTSSRGVGIDMIVIHDVEGTAASAAAWFQNPAAQVSAHYAVAFDGTTIYQCVDDAYTAWHCGNHDYNHRSIGIEHSGH